MKGFAEYECTGFRTGGDSHELPGLQTYCYSSPTRPEIWRSGYYAFRANPRAASTTPPINCSLVDTLVLTDGSKYALDGLDEGAISQTVKAAINGTVQSAIKKLGLCQI